MDENDLHERELLLLLTSLSEQQGPGPAAAPRHAAGALAELQQGQYAQALARCLGELAPVGAEAQPECSPDWFEAAAAAAQRQLGGGGGDIASAERLLHAAVAALYLFVQANLSGPAIDLPACPFDLLAGGGGGGESPAAAGFGEDSACPGDRCAAAAALPCPERAARLHASPRFSMRIALLSVSLSLAPSPRWAAAELSESGEELIGLIAYPQYLLLARTVLMAPLEAAGGAPAAAAAAAAAGSPWPCAALPSWRWWAARALLLQQRLLAGRSARLRAALLSLTSAVLGHFAPPGLEERCRGGDEGDHAPLRRQLAAAALLEAAQMETSYGDVAAARAHFDRCGAVLGLRAELGGVLGLRTVHQQEAKAQLVVKVGRDAALPRLSDAAPPDCRGLDAWLAGEGHVSQELQGMGAELEPDVLLRPRYLDDESGNGTAVDSGTAAGSGGDGTAENGAGQGQGSGGVPTDLSSLEQALLLGLCVQLKRGTAADGLRPWEMAAFVDAVERQTHSQVGLRG